MVELDRAVAVATADGPRAGPALVDALPDAGEPASYHVLPTASSRPPLPGHPRGPLHRPGAREQAAAAYREALRPAPTERERRFPARRLAEVRGD